METTKQSEEKEPRHHPASLDFAKIVEDERFWRERCPDAMRCLPLGTGPAALFGRRLVQCTGSWR